jgi:hypothetical protein
MPNENQMQKANASEEHVMNVYDSQLSQGEGK